MTFFILMNDHIFDDDRGAALGEEDDGILHRLTGDDHVADNNGSSVLGYDDDVVFNDLKLHDHIYDDNGVIVGCLTRCDAVFPNDGVRVSGEASSLLNFIDKVALVHATCGSDTRDEEDGGE